jgi:hypothetical protein
MKTGDQIAWVISPEGRLQGTVTDGDVRRALLRRQRGPSGFTNGRTLSELAELKALKLSVSMRSRYTGHM